ncbi:DUF3592 domain-containing protein [Solibaculum mannosilyticum]|uniref:DUF3592 domain-containing protein n=1 Tax=Solibaculum mannosilyticum TaxID=2780922 RepID=A0A7I8D1K7_9FIRM|nr:DUF3592 domain-containing protein [Solibaculum mannosilyticum]MCO7137007.1 DUF3592 domain-containing protein [[Clostridium] leptum]BCI60688.1 hypothetical protein C12CBH8_13270 [Solibaculum mannosilyticum]CZT57708.1 hypothetical protein BN3661_02140 [Eubacteriaceae bacterium CHKCI005]
MPKAAKIVSLSLIVICLLCGVWMIYLGIGESMDTSEKTQNYQTTQGYLLDYNLYSGPEYDAVRKRQTSATYQLTYNYNVDGQEYKVTTESGTSFVPEIGTAIEIKYNPDNPQEAYIPSQSRNVGLLFGGAFFIVIPLIMLLIFTGVLQKLPSKLVGIIMGLVLILLSWFVLYMITGSFSPVGIAQYYVSSFSFPLIIPILLIAAGLLLIVRNLLPSRKNVKESI